MPRDVRVLLDAERPTVVALLAGLDAFGDVRRRGEFGGEVLEVRLGDRFEPLGGVGVPKRGEREPEAGGGAFSLEVGASRRVEAREILHGALGEEF